MEQNHFRCFRPHLSISLSLDGCAIIAQKMAGRSIHLPLRPYQVSAIHSGMSWQTPVVVYGMGTADAGKNIAEGANLYKQRVEMLIGSSNAGNNW